jgi:hypothetical protein
MITRKAIIFIEAATTNNNLNPTLEERNPQTTLNKLILYLLNPFPNAPDTRIQ